MKKILLISTFYPPIQHIATNRIVSFAKYLNKQKYRVFVISINPGEEAYEDLDGVTVYRLSNNSIFKKLRSTYPSPKRTHPLYWIRAAYTIFIHSFHLEMHDWEWKAIALARTLAETQGIDVIISSFPSITPHRVALHIKQRYPFIRWIADMRDEMVSPGTRTAWLRALHQQWQAETLQYADAVTTVSEPLLDDFRQSCPRHEVLFKEIRNGYDFEIDTTFHPSNNNVCTIVYTGTLLGRKTDNLFKVLEKLIQERNVLIKIKFFGISKKLYFSENLKRVITIYERVEHATAIQQMKQADILLLILPTIRQKGVYSGKLFEYLASLKPILALVPPDDVAAQLIRDCNAGYIADNEDLKGIEQALLTAYNDWLTGKVLQRNLDLVKKHHRREQAKILDALIDELFNK